MNVHSVNLDELHLSQAEALLRSAGHVLPLPGEMSGAYVQAVVDGLCDLSSRDALTGVANRRAFNGVLSQELDRVARAGESALLLAVDIDHFKRVNDRHGHLAGDMVIRAVSQALQQSVRPMDTVARVGGEEFAVVLPNCPVSFGAVVAERVRSAVAGLQLSYQSSVLQVTVSCGGAYAAAWVRSTPEVWLDRADRQLYLAKEQGRNRVCLEPTAMTEVSAEEKGLLFAWAAADGLIIDPSNAH